MKAAGIDATFQGLSVNAWNADVADGDFSVTEHWSNSGLTPYTMYEGWLDSSLASGSAATGDFERLNNPAINADLAKLAGASTVAEQTADLVPIEQYAASNLPIIPVTTVIIEDGQIVRRAFSAGARSDGDDRGDGEPPGTAADPAALDVSGHAAQIADLLAALDEGREPAVNGQAGRDALQIVCAVYESARSGRTVTLGS